MSKEYSLQMSHSSEKNPSVCTHNSVDRSCGCCSDGNPSGPHTSLNLRLPLLVQCPSPIEVPPLCAPRPGQVLLSICSGLFYFWNKVIEDNNHDGEPDGCHYEWKVVKCNECAPISFRQSQIFYYDCFTGSEEVVGPTIEGCTAAVPKQGDYVIDCANHNVWVYQYNEDSQTCEWLLKQNCFGSANITIEKTVGNLVYNCTSMLFELLYQVRVSNIGDRDFTSITLTDDVRAQAVAAGLVSPTITFITPPTDLAFAEAAFASTNSNILVNNKPLAANTSKLIAYKLTASAWSLASNICTTTLKNTLTLTQAVENPCRNHASSQTAVTNTTLSAGVFGGQGRLDKKFGPGRIDNSTKTITSTVTLTVSNFGTTPITINSLLDDVFTQLGSNAFSSPGNPSARWICGSGSLPSVNNSYEGKTQTNVLSGNFVLAAGKTFAVDFDLQFQQSILSTLTATSPFTNIATLNFTDVLTRSMQCTARDQFFCKECPQLKVDKDIEYIRCKKSRIDLYTGVSFNTSRQCEIAYEVALKLSFVNTGCVTLCDVNPYINIEDYMVANGVVPNQRGLVFNPVVTIIDKFPNSGPSVTANGSFTGTNNTLASSSNRLISQSNLDLLPGQGFNVLLTYDYVPANNSRRGVVDVPPPSCTEGNVNGTIPGFNGNAQILVQYESVCQNGVQSMNLVLPMKSNDMPNITLEKSTVQLMDLSDRFTATTDVYFQIDAYATPIDQTPSFVAGPTYAPPVAPATVTTPPPPAYNCYQATFKYKVTNSGNVPLDEIRICDNFFDQLIGEFNGGGASPFCGYYVVCPPPILIAGPPNGDDSHGSFSGNASWNGLDAGEPYIAGGDGLLLPGTSIEFSVVVRFCIDPKVSIRLKNDCVVLARGPNECYTFGQSRGHIPIIGPSLCFSKNWVDGYPLQVVGTNGLFEGQLVYTVYNDGDRRALDVEVLDYFTDGTYDVTFIDNVSTAPTSTRKLVWPCSTISGESPTNPAWTGNDNVNPVNYPPLPYLDRSELFTVYTPKFRFRVDNIHHFATNTATVNSHTIYDNPALNTTKVLPDLRAYKNYSGPGDNLKFGLLCRHSTLTVDPANAFRDCPLMPQSLVMPNIANRAQLVSSTPGNVLYDVTFSIPYENSVNGSIVNVATVNSITITSTTSFPAGVSSQSITFVDPSPVIPGGTATLTWTERIKWTGTDSSMNPPSLPYLSYNVVVDNIVSLDNASCHVLGEAAILPDPFVYCPPTPQAPLLNPATVVSSTPGAVQYDVTYQYYYNNGNTPTQDINVTRTTVTYPSGITSLSLTFNDPSPVATNAGVLLSWTERIQWNGTLYSDIPPTMPQLTYNVQFTNTAGLNATCAYTGNVVTLVNPIPAPPPLSPA